MDADRIPIADLQPGDQFRLSHVLPILTVDRIKYDSIGHGHGRVRLLVREEASPIDDTSRRKVWRVKGQAQA